MNKVLSKRIPREFKSNLPKYIALLLLIALCMYLVTAIVASSETIIDNSVYRRCSRLRDRLFANVDTVTA